MKYLVFREVVNFGGEAKRYILTIKDVMVAITRPPKEFANTDAKRIRIKPSSIASSYLLFSSFHLIIIRLEKVAKDISMASMLIPRVD